MNNINILYYLKAKYPIKITISFLLLIVLLIYSSFKYYTYDIREVLVINECSENECTLKTTLNYEEQDILNQTPIISYGNKDYEIKDITYNEAYLSNEVPVTDISLKTDIKEEKKILKIKLKYNKQRIINKLKEKIIERK